MKLRHLLTITTSILVLSCQKENNKDLTANQDSASTSTSKAVQPNTGNVAVQNTATTTGMLNPEHGQPNHRCDIAVGAPLDGAPQQSAVTMPTAPQPAPAQFNTNPINTSPIPTAANNGAKPAINPAHGQPHHRCDIEVGAPLI